MDGDLQTVPGIHAVGNGGLFLELSGILPCRSDNFVLDCSLDGLLDPGHDHALGVRKKEVGDARPGGWSFCRRRLFFVRDV